jgi:ABC-2 type transport system permease protein
VDGFVAAAFSMTQLIVALLVVTLLVAARGEESTGRLELVLAMPRSRTSWLGGRILLSATVALATTALAAGSIWIGASITGEHVRVNGLAAAVGNTIPLIVIATGFTATILAIWPRAVSFTYGVVAATYLWDALGTALKAPEWSLKISPFHALSRVPLQQFAITPAAVLTVTGIALITLSLLVFRRRDLATV